MIYSIIVSWSDSFLPFILMRSVWCSGSLFVLLCLGCWLCSHSMIGMRGGAFFVCHSIIPQRWLGCLFVFSPSRCLGFGLRVWLRVGNYISNIQRWAWLPLLLFGWSGQNPGYPGRKLPDSLSMVASSMVVLSGECSSSARCFALPMAISPSIVPIYTTSSFVACCDGLLVQSLSILLCYTSVW